MVKAQTIVDRRLFARFGPEWRDEARTGLARRGNAGPGLTVVVPVVDVGKVVVFVGHGFVHVRM